MVTEQIEQLKKLQDILIEKLGIEKQLGDIPKNIVVKKELLDRMRERYKSNSESCEKKQQELVRLRLELEKNENEREKMEGQIEHVNTQREYETLEKEIRECSGKERIIREHQEVLRVEIEQLQESLTQEQELTKEQEEELHKAEQEINEQSALLNKELARLEKNETRLADSFSAEFLFKFQRIIGIIGGRGIVPLSSTVCSGCHMTLPNHIANEVRREKEILFCPYCSKVLYYASAEAGGDGETDVKVADADLVEEFEGALGNEINFDGIFSESEELEDEYRQQGDMDEDHEEGEGEEEEDVTEYAEGHYENGGDEETQISIDDTDNKSFTEINDEGDESDEDFAFTEDV